MNTNKFTIITDNKNWMEGNAISQAKNLCGLDGVEEVFAMPDLHTGKTPVGVVVITKDRIYPHLIGTDIGCGMSVFSAGLQVKKIKLDRWGAKLNTIKTLAAVPNNEYFSDCPIHDFGSIGSGNHFAEFQTIQTVYDETALKKLILDKDELYLTVHSGSRNYGSKILAEFDRYSGYAAESSEAGAYLEKHNDALIWASKNRFMVAKKLIDYLGLNRTVEKKLECGHNFLEFFDGSYYHRKGAVSSKSDAVLIAGSRGALSYIVKPTEKCAEYGFSLAHGSGRKWARGMCKSRIRDKYTSETIKQNKYGGMLVCHDYSLLYEEAPEVYKNVDTIISVLTKFEMIEPIASLKPMLTFKG